MDGRAPATHAAAGAGGTEPNGGQQSMAQATHPLRLGAVRAAPARRPPSNHHIPVVRAREGGGRRGRTTALVAAAVSKERASATGRAAEVVRDFYEGVNRRDLAAVAPLIAEGCVYEDLVFPRPMVGRDRVVGFFGEFMGSVSPDLRFVIDDISVLIGCLNSGMACRVEGAAVPVQQGLQLLPVPARPKSAGPDSDRVWPGLRGAGDQTRRAGAGGHQGSDVDPRAVSEHCRQALTDSIRSSSRHRRNNELG